MTCTPGSELQGSHRSCSVRDWTACSVPLTDSASMYASIAPVSSTLSAEARCFKQILSSH